MVVAEDAVAGCRRCGVAAEIAGVVGAGAGLAGSQRAAGSVAVGVAVVARGLGGLRGA